jgi:hypothetical protein
MIIDDIRNDHRGSLNITIFIYYSLKLRYTLKECKMRQTF